jgi:hypothetical protein
MKIAIVGTEEHTRHLAPWNDPEYKIWVFNEAANAGWCKRWDICFQLHPKYIYRDLNNGKDPKHWEWLQQDHGSDKKILMQELDYLVPNSQRYPLDEINESFMSTLTWEGEQLKNYRATVSYAIALAMWMGADCIDIYGVELVHTAEYRSQQMNFAFWVGVATGRKIPVTLHCSRGTFDQPYYGYETYMEETRLQQMLDGLKAQLEEEMAKVNQIRGAIQVCMQLMEDEKSNEKLPNIPQDN